MRSSWVPAHGDGFPLDSCLACLNSQIFWLSQRYNCCFHLISLASSSSFLVAGTRNGGAGCLFSLQFANAKLVGLQNEVWRLTNARLLHKRCPTSLKNAGRVVFGVPVSLFMASFSWLPARTCCFTKIRAGDRPAGRRSSWGGICLAPGPAVALP